MEGITSEWLLGKVDHKNKKLISKEDVISGVLESDAQIVVTIGGEIEN
jgi:UDP-N-acetylmuramate--alanine ligase